MRVGCEELNTVSSWAV